MAANPGIELGIPVWRGGRESLEQTFKALKARAEELCGVGLSVQPRSGIGHSFRGITEDRADRPVWVLLDVLEPDNEPWWLSICFFADSITDPDDLGEVIPGGLFGADGYCFDIEKNDEQIINYLSQRLTEAWQSASEG